ncbi:MAG: CinA family protein [Pirellulaceae bacterium]|nr:CinA family protein [Pirellulaceae bacterium]
MNEERSPIVVDIDSELNAIRNLLVQNQQRLVLVESCTAGLVSALLGKIPGISDVLCGSMVVYRNDSKHRWLGIDRQVLEDSDIGPVSQRVTEELARAALDRTPEATVAAAVTGHLGPNAPAGLDGRVFTCVIRREAIESIQSTTHQLTSDPPKDSEDWKARQLRQTEAVKRFLREIRNALERL